MNTENTDEELSVDDTEEIEEFCILDECEEFLRKYIHATDTQIWAMLLYAAATHAMKVLATMGRMLFVSDEPESGKTMAMLITAMLCANPQDASGTSYALQSALAEAANTPEMDRPTFYYDEIPYGKAGLRANVGQLDDVLKKGYKWNATSRWSVNRVAEEFSIFVPFLMSGLRVAVPTDIRSRSIVIHMRRGTPPEYFDVREGERNAEELSTALGGTVRNVLDDIRAFRARGIHPKLVGRKLEVWEPLFAVAQQLGGQKWVNRCASAFTDLALGGSDQLILSSKQMTVRDVAQVVETFYPDHEFVGGLWIVDELMRLDDPRYADLTDIAVAKMVSAAYPFNSVQQRVRGFPNPVRGYYARDLIAAWERIRPDDEDDVEIPEEQNPFGDE